MRLARSAASRSLMVARPSRSSAAAIARPARKAATGRPESAARAYPRATTRQPPGRACAPVAGDALRIDKVFGVSMDTLMRMQNSYDIAKARMRAGEIEVAVGGIRFAARIEHQARLKDPSVTA